MRPRRPARLPDRRPPPADPGPARTRAQDRHQRTDGGDRDRRLHAHGRAHEAPTTAPTGADAHARNLIVPVRRPSRRSGVIDWRSEDLVDHVDRHADDVPRRATTRIRAEQSVPGSYRRAERGSQHPPKARTTSPSRRSASGRCRTAARSAPPGARLPPNPRLPRATMSPSARVQPEVARREQDEDGH